MWMEAKPVATINAASIKKFIWEFIICHFGLPMNVVSDNRTQFADRHNRAWLAELNISQTYSYVAYPQGNGEVEHANHSIVGGIKQRLEGLTYGTEAMIPAKIGLPSPRVLLSNDNESKGRLDLMLLEERRELAAMREQNYKCQLQKYYDAKVKFCEFNAGDYVLRNNEALRAHALGKLS
ncbi:uncharacterized protein LOC143637262 [Bidens hawaiensis]|uniref:uncharacterized protein LOC143637262 n=1 Tax=Bidens hawaiensis TaxID=980011 RepID=UPI00404A8CE0